MLHLERKGDVSKLLGGPVCFVPRRILAGWDPNAGAMWERPVFRNGRHRFQTQAVCGTRDPHLIAEHLCAFDEWAAVGRVIAVTDFDLSKPDDQEVHAIGIARLASVSSGLTYQGQSLQMQRWQTLNPMGVDRG